MVIKAKKQPIGMLIEITSDMKKALIRFMSITFCLPKLIIEPVVAQEATELKSDVLFTQKRNIANYPQIILLLKTALKRNLDYVDIRLFIYRLYTWSDKLDTVNYQVLAKNLFNKFPLFTSGALYHEEYRTNTWGNQFSVGLWLSKRF